MTKDERIVMLLSIIRRGKGAQYIKMLKEQGLFLNYQSVGEGTASSEMMDLLGLGNNDKDIMFSFGTYKAVDRLCGVIAIIATMPKASVITLPPIAWHAPMANGRIKVVAIGPEATPPESKAIPV